jgi:hypothetical protein
VLTADFHLHMFPMDESVLSPWDVVLESRRRGLDVIALTGHNHVWAGKIGRWFAGLTGKPPLVLVGEEVITPTYDMIAVGIEHKIDWRGTAAETAQAIHAQGGIAIAPHPLKNYWPAFDDAAMRELDGAEVVHPVAFAGEEYASQLREFYERRPLAAIGSSDFHGNGHPGYSRTYVFVRQVSRQVSRQAVVSQQAVIDALRAHRTVVVGPDGRAYGDAELIRLANGSLPRAGVEEPEGAWGWVSRVSALLGMVVALVFGRRQTT